METQVQGIQQALREIEELVAPLTPQQLEWRAAPDTWSILQNLEHLTITAREMMPAMDAGCARGPKASANPKPWAPGLFARWFLKSLEPPVKRKIKTGAKFIAPSGRPAEAVMTEFRDTHKRLLEKMPFYLAHDLNRVKVTSPFARFLHYSLGTAIAIFPAHLRRHLEQMRQVRRGQSENR